MYRGEKYVYMYVARGTNALHGVGTLYEVPIFISLVPVCQKRGFAETETAGFYYY